MLRTAVALAAFALATGASAQNRPSTVTMTCGEAARLVQSQGGIVLGTGGPTFDRFVANRSFCEPTEAVKRAFVPTRDTPACLVGYRCFEPGRSDWFGDF